MHGVLAVGLLTVGFSEHLGFSLCSFSHVVKHRSGTGLGRTSRGVLRGGGCPAMKSDVLGGGCPAMKSDERQDKRSDEGHDKRILFVRHGLTEMNIFLGSSHYGSPGFKDPGKWDTRLAPRGIAQAESLNSRLLKEAATWSSNKDEAIDLVVCSPLSRALHTASLAFAGEQLQTVPRVVHAGIRERIWLTSDVGKSPDELTAAWSQQGWDFSGLEQTWWYTDTNWKRGDTDWRKKGDYLCSGEPEQPFIERLTEFKEWLLRRPEKRIAVVAHWGAIYGLTGKSLDNCETLELPLSQFKSLEVFVTD